MKKIMKKGMLLIITGLLLIAAALILIGYNIRQSQEGGKAAGEVVKELEKQLEDEPEESEEEAPEAEMPLYRRYPQISMPTLPVDGENYIGLLMIPSLDLELPIMEQWSYEGLRVAPGRYKGSVYTEDLIIAGHNYDSHFGHLKDLSQGSEVTFIDVEGHRFVYEVVTLEVIPETNAADMEQGEWDLTLFTCDYGGYNRVTVRCRIKK